MAQHALLSPSSAHRWLHCTPSAVLESKYPDSTSTYAEEGTIAHELGETLIRKHFNLITDAKFKSSITKIKQSEYFDQQMLSHCKDYKDYIVLQYNRLVAENKGKVHIKIEQKLSLSNYIPQSFGTSDCFIYNDTTLIIIDLKFGKGVEVSAVENDQLKIYALGAVGHVYETNKIETVEMHVYQPRLNNIESYTLSRVELATWYKEEVFENAKLAFAGKGDYKAGEHCKFCRALKNCQTAAKYNMERIDEDLRLPNALSKEFITKVILNAKFFESWLNEVKAFALEQAQKGVKFPDLKIVEGKSNRKIEDTQGAAMQLALAGIKNEVIYKPRELNTIGNLEKQLGIKELKELLEDYLIKPEGAPTLVPLSDKRPEIGIAKAERIFDDLFS